MTAPKVETPEQLEELTPERAGEVIAALVEQYHKDWGRAIAGVQAELGLSYHDVTQYLMLRELALVRNSFNFLARAIEKLREPVYHEDCAGCREAKRFHELQLEMMELTIRHLKDEHGEDWKGEP